MLTLKPLKAREPYFKGFECNKFAELFVSMDVFRDMQKGFQNDFWK